MGMDKSKLIDAMGRPLTQGLFLEHNYDIEKAVYTLKSEDYEYKGVVYPSLRKRYMESDDPTEYSFVSQWLVDWKHWLRLCDNKAIREHIEEWRLEMEMKMRSAGVKEMIRNAKSGSPMAAKWLYDKGWDLRSAGRPSKDEINKEKNILLRISEEYAADVERLQ